MAEGAPLRGEVWLIAFEGRGSEVRNTRPAVVVGNDLANARLDRLQVVPLSSKVERIYPAEALVLMNGVPRKAMADQVTTADRARLLRRIAIFPPGDLDLLSRAIRLQLGL